MFLIVSIYPVQANKNYLYLRNIVSERVDTIRTTKSTVEMYKLVNSRWYKIDYNKITKRSTSEVMSSKFTKTYIHKSSIDSILKNWEHTNLTYENIIKLSIALDIEKIDVFFHQVLIESGNLTSNVCRLNNNIKGMRHPTQRFTYSIKDKNGYATYKSWVYSVADYRLWQLQSPWSSKKESYGSYLDRRGYSINNIYGYNIDRFAKKVFEPYMAFYIEEKKRHDYSKFMSPFLAGCVFNFLQPKEEFSYYLV